MTDVYHRSYRSEDRRLQTSSMLTPSDWALSTPLQTVTYRPLAERGLTLKIKREDALDSRLSGNKLYKLHGHLQLARQQSASRLLSFGGYYSNHLHALAHLGRATGTATLGVVRGHAPSQLSPTLQDCLEQGMELHFVSRQQYRHLREAGRNSMSALMAGLQQAVPLNDPRMRATYVIPEGGGGAAGLAGCAAIMSALRAQADLRRATICVACGTGTTLAGLLSESAAGEQLLGFAALKLGDQLPEFRAEVEAQLGNKPIGAQWDIRDDSTFGGFGKTDARLFAFMQDFEAATGVLLDPVYTAKMLFQVVRMAEAGCWPAGHEIIVVHTGGLQGRRGYTELTHKDFINMATDPASNTAPNTDSENS